MLKNIEILANNSTDILWTDHPPLPDPGELPVRAEHIHQNVCIILDRMLIWFSL